MAEKREGPPDYIDWEAIRRSEGYIDGLRVLLADQFSAESVEKISEIHNKVSRVEDLDRFIQEKYPDMNSEEVKEFAKGLISGTDEIYEELSKRDHEVDLESFFRKELKTGAITEEAFDDFLKRKADRNRKAN